MQTEIADQGENGSVTFKCPNCLKGEIQRTGQARALVAKYTCQECGFVGPN